MSLRLFKPGLLSLLLGVFALVSVMSACPSAAMSAPMPSHAVEQQASMDCHGAQPEKPASDTASHKDHQLVCATGCVVPPSGLTPGAAMIREPERVAQAGARRLHGRDGRPVIPPPRELVA